MINVKAGNVSVNGDKAMIMAELTALISMLVENGFDWEDIDLIVETAKLSPDELEDSTVKCLKEILDWLSDK